MYQTHILKNGLKVIHQQVDGKAAWGGLIIGVGSRDERPEEEGIAHFIEHVIFKGTEKRKAFHILSRIEDVGGELNAYTKILVFMLPSWPGIMNGLWSCSPISCFIRYFPKKR